MNCTLTKFRTGLPLWWDRQVAIRTAVIKNCQAMMFIVIGVIILGLAYLYVAALLNLNLYAWWSLTIVTGAVICYGIHRFFKNVCELAE